MAINVATGFADGDIFTASGGQPANISRAALAADAAFQVYAVPAGGTTGQALVKDSNTDHDVSWGTVAGGSVSAGSVTGLAAFVEAYMANTPFMHAWDGTQWEAADGGALNTDTARFHINISTNDAAATTPTGRRVGDLWFGTD